MTLLHSFSSRYDNRKGIETLNNVGLILNSRQFGEIGLPNYQERIIGPAQSNSESIRPLSRRIDVELERDLDAMLMYLFSCFSYHALVD